MGKYVYLFRRCPVEGVVRPLLNERTELTQNHVEAEAVHEILKLRRHRA